MTTFINEYDIKYKKYICNCNNNKYTIHKIIELINLKICLKCNKIKYIK